MESSTERIVEVESSTDDAFEAVASKTLDPLPERYVSSKTVGEGEGLRFEVTRAETVVDRFDDDKDRVEPKYVTELEGTVLESRAHRFKDNTTIVVACRSVRLEELANASPQPGDIVTLVHSGYEGTPRRVEVLDRACGAGDMSGQQAKLVWEDMETHVARKERRSHEILDVSAFRRLLRRYGRPDGTIDGRPKDTR